MNELQDGVERTGSAWKDLGYTVVLGVAFGFAVTSLVLLVAAAMGPVAAAPPALHRGRFGVHPTSVGKFAVASALLIFLVWCGGAVMGGMDAIIKRLNWQPTTAIPTLLTLPCAVAGAYLAFGLFLGVFGLLG